MDEKEDDGWRMDRQCMVHSSRVGKKYYAMPAVQQSNNFLHFHFLGQ